MLITPINVSVNMQGRNLKPISEYQGPILKLTSKEKTQIAQMEARIAEYELEIEKLNSLSQKSHVISSIDYYNDKIGYLDYWIDKLRNEIRNIKISRLNKQKQRIESNKSNINR